MTLEKKISLSPYLTKMLAVRFIHSSIMGLYGKLLSINWLAVWKHLNLLSLPSFLGSPIISPLGKKKGDIFSSLWIQIYIRPKNTVILLLASSFSFSARCGLRHSVLPSLNWNKVSHIDWIKGSVKVQGKITEI